MPATTLTPGQLAYWSERLEAAGTNHARANALWDLARKVAGEDEALWADLVRLLQNWTQEAGRRTA